MTVHRHELTINELDAVSSGKDFDVSWSGGGDAMQLQKLMERQSKLLDTLASYRQILVTAGAGQAAAVAG